ncbi:alpha/beta fold hydrolase [Streptomyces mesophilus]|uniref:alpha/beta fold hydrolase n=1 Tax=Streptomyces mesophilus TaxID=1775132 RepID=UPI00331ED17A
MTRHKQLLQVGQVELCAETFGDRSDPAVLLIMGGGASMDWWEDAFCERLAAGPRFVIRYDHRDTGESVSYEPGAPGYTGEDLVSDPVGVLDALGIARAHVVGLSMGGGIAQALVVAHPDRVATLTLMSTSAGGEDLPPMSKELQAAFSAPAPEPDWSDRESVLDYLVEDARLYAAPSRTFETEAMRALIGRAYDRTTNMASAMNHFLLDGAGGATRAQLATVSAPTLVLHGTEDPMFPYEHGQALARAIPGARLVPLERTGHEIPEAAWDVAVPEILRHTAE